MMFSALGLGNTAHCSRALLERKSSSYSDHILPDHIQAKLRLEMEMERMRQTHSKEMESRDEEVEEARQSCQKKVWYLGGDLPHTNICSLVTTLN